MRNFSSRRLNKAVVAATISVVVLVLVMFTFFTGLQQHQITQSSLNLDGKHSLVSTTSSSRKLLGIGSGVVAALQPKRIWGEKCTKSDIVVIQGPTTSLPNGIPTYTVQIMNLCVSGCDISKIHLKCGWFSSARLINPKVFKRLGFNDCLVNDGKKLANGRTLSFQYANTFRYPLSVSSVSC